MNPWSYAYQESFLTKKLNDKLLSWFMKYSSFESTVFIRHSLSCDFFFLENPNQEDTDRARNDFIQDHLGKSIKLLGLLTGTWVARGSYTMAESHPQHGHVKSYSIEVSLGKSISNHTAKESQSINYLPHVKPGGTERFPVEPLKAGIPVSFSLPSVMDGKSVGLI